uniref:DNA-binding protein n=1 Tax=Vibrio alfacsensis TaxID=1074311 RepID=UPI0019CFACE4|nr:DNA-binding protein [Vibrio alfacsensis]
MARPKSYTDEDVIKIANQLVAKGKVPSGWHIKEELGRGKISAIQSDLDRLTQEGHISVAPLTADDDKEAEATVPMSYDIPVELQELLAKREKELYKVMLDMTTALNNRAHEHYETIMAIRIREFDAKYNLVNQAKERAETELIDVEQRLQKQVEAKEKLEDKIEDLELELAQSKQDHSELLQHNLQLTNNVSTAAEKYEALQDKHHELLGRIQHDKKNVQPSP